MPTAPRPRWAAPEPFYRFVAPPLNAVIACMFRIRVVGGERVPRSGRVLLAANHVSGLDPLMLAGVFYRLGRRPRFLALADLFSYPVRGWFLRVSRMIPVVRGGGVEPMVEEACAALEAGQAVVVYPEGRIVRPGEPSQPKPGAGLLALLTDAPVLPVGTWGLAPGQGRKAPIRKRVTVVIGPPVDLADWRGRASERDVGLAASERVLDQVRESVARARGLHEG